MHFNLRDDAFSRTLITAHRGAAGGNIPCNSLASFDAALYQGADMIELDVSATSDGQLLIFHPGMEAAHLCHDRRLNTMTAAEARELRFHNQDRTATTHGIATLDEALEHLKGRCYINIDKYWEHIVPITEAVRRHGMIDQVLVKTAPSEDVFRMMEEVAPDVPYMLIMRGADEYSEQMKRRRINYVGAETLFAADDEPICSPEYVEWMHKNGWLLWGNSIVYDYKAVIAAAHTDDNAITGHPDESWGWLIDRGYNIIQTDWPMALRCYLDKRTAQSK